MTKDELIEAVARALHEQGNYVAWGDTCAWEKMRLRDRCRPAIRVCLEAAAEVSQSYEPHCDTCPSGVANAIRALIPGEGKS